MADKKISQLPASTTPLAGTEVLAVVQSGDTKQVSVANLTVDRPVSMATVQVTGATPPQNGLFLPTANNVGMSAGNTEVMRWDSGSAQLRNGAAFYVYNATNDGLGLWYNPGGAGVNQIVGRVNGADRLTIDGATGNIINHTGNLVIGTAGKGIDFSADGSAAGMTSELLDDYEEGTWTPSVAPIVGSITSYTSSGTYTKVGRLVTVNFDFTITNNGTGSVGIGLQGLPFAAASAYAGQGTAAEVAITGYQCLAYFANVNTIYMFKYDWTYPGTLNTRIVGTVSYIV